MHLISIINTLINIYITFDILHVCDSIIQRDNFSIVSIHVHGVSAHARMDSSNNINVI